MRTHAGASLCFWGTCDARAGGAGEPGPRAGCCAVKLPPYGSVEEALSVAYGMEARAVCPVSRAFACLRGGTVRRDRALTVWDRHAQAAMIGQLVHRTLKGPERASLDGRFTVPADASLAQRQRGACYGLALWVHWRLKRAPVWYVVDVTREWCGLKRDHTEVWWQGHLGVSESTLRRLKYGRRDRDQPGVFSLLDALYEAALGKLEQPMRENGWLVD